MSFLNTSYAIVQVAHNFGTIAVGSCLFLSLINHYTHSIRLQKKLIWITLTGWAVQGLSGFSFGAVSLYYHGKFPDIHGLALAALIVKIFCTAAGFSVALAYIRYAANWQESGRNLSWKIMTALFITALTAAAILRWFS